MRTHHPYAVLTTIMLVSLLGTAGIALPYPLLSPYFANENIDPLVHFMQLDPKILLGITLASYPLGTLIGSSIIGSLSDRYGRKIVLIYSLVGSVIGYCLTAFAFQHSSFIGFVLARVMTGFCEGNISIARAMAVELHPQISRDRALALLYTTVYGGWLIGPLAGGLLSSYGIAITFYVASGAVLLSLIMVIVILPKHPPQKPSEISLWKEIKTNHSISLLKQPAIRQFFVYYFIYTLGINAYYEYYPLWLVEELQADSMEIAWVTVAITSLMVIISSTIAASIPERIGHKNALLGGNLLFGALILFATFVDAPLVYLPIALTGAVIAVINLVFPAMLSQHFGHRGQGKVMGLQVSVFCFTNVIIAIVGALVALISATVTLWLSALLIIISVFTFRTPSEDSSAEQSFQTHSMKEPDNV